MTDAEKIALLRKRLAEAVEALGQLPDDIFGARRGTEGTYWWIRDEMRVIWDRALEDTAP